MSIYVYQRLLAALKGYFYWKTLEKKYPKTEKFIIFSGENEEYDYWGLKILPQYMESKKKKKILLLFWKENNIACDTKKIEKKVISHKNMENMLAYFALWDMSDKWIVVSTKKPYDTGAERLLGKNGITIKDIVKYDVYKLG